MAIRFSCKCGHAFDLPDEEAGGLIQCDKCGLLNDIPLHQDLEAISDDGVYKMDDAPVLNNPDTAAELIYVYSRGASDIFGDDKDLRTSDHELDEARGETIPIDDPVRTDAPKYDPETGELIDAFDLADGHKKNPPHPSTIPIATATLNYAGGRGPRSDVSLARAFPRVFSPPNLAVMGAILVMHLLLMPLQFVVSAGIFFLGVGIPTVFLALIAHYGNIIEDMGPFEKDDFPRPLRDLEFLGDVWLPFCNVFGSLLMCYWPLMPIWITLSTVPGLPLMAPLIALAIVAGLGTFVFPAVVLTLVGGGTPLNLRPDRLITVISQCGAGYFFTMIVWILAALTYIWGFVGSAMAIAESMNQLGSHWYIQWRVVLPMLVAGIVLTHYFCYCVALLYRAHHIEFPWVLQRHTPAPKAVVAPPNRPPRKQPQAPPIHIKARTRRS